MGTEALFTGGVAILELTDFEMYFTVLRGVFNELDLCFLSDESGVRWILVPLYIYILKYSSHR